MRAGEARAAARAWVAEHAPDAAAFFHGSTTELPDDAALWPWSDVDVVVVGEAPADGAPGKRACGGALLDIAYVPREAFGSAEAVLGRYQLATSFRNDGIIADPGGWLAPLQAEVARRFAEPRWVRARCDDASANVRRHAARCAETRTREEAAISALFACGVLAHVVLVAAQRNPTVRTRYAAAREVMHGHGLAPEYEALLRVAGYAALPGDTVRAAFDAMTGAFDAAVSAGAVDMGAGISPDARPVAVDGSRDLIERGLHREAMYWIAVTWARCRLAARAGPGPAAAGETAPARSASHADRDVLADIGIASTEDARTRARAALDHLPAVEAMAARIAERRGG